MADRFVITPEGWDFIGSRADGLLTWDGGAIGVAADLSRVAAGRRYCDLAEFMAAHGARGARWIDASEWSVMVDAPELPA